MNIHAATASQPYMTVSEAAAYMRCSRWTVYRLLNRNALTALRVGERLRFRVSDLDAYMARGASGEP